MRKRCRAVRCVAGEISADVVDDDDDGDDDDEDGWRDGGDEEEAGAEREKEGRVVDEGKGERDGVRSIM